MNQFKHILTIALLFGGLALHAQSKGKETISVKTNIYCDHCKQCESCGARIYAQLMDKPGISKVKMDEENSSIIVTYNSAKTDAKSVRDAINDAGFDADDQLAPAESVEKLDLCCRKQ